MWVYRMDHHHCILIHIDVFANQPKFQAFYIFINKIEFNYLRIYHKFL